MTNEIVSLATIQERIREQVREKIADLLPDDAIDGLIKEEYRKLLQSALDAYGNQKPSKLQTMISDELKAILLTQIRDYLQSDACKLLWSVDGSVGLLLTEFITADRINQVLRMWAQQEIMSSGYQLRSEVESWLRNKGL